MTSILVYKHHPQKRKVMKDQEEMEAGALLGGGWGDGAAALGGRVHGGKKVGGTWNALTL